MKNPSAWAFAAALLTSSGWAAPAETQSAPRRPNIVILLADQWRASAMGYAGDPNVKTPNLDQLAHEAWNFRNAVSVCPVCTPFRAALMTGRYPTSTGMFVNDEHLPDTELCIAQVLKAAGYTTGYIGKWHLDGHGRTAYIPPERRRGWEYWKAGECDHDYNHSHYYTDASDVKHFWPGYDAFAQTSDAQQYVRDHARGPQPFALVVAYGPPHFPYVAVPEQYKALYPPDRIKLAPNVPANLQALARKDAQGYYGHCTAVDRCVGDILHTLTETGVAQDTIVLFSADHGEMLGAHGCPPSMKQVAWSESANVPFLLRYPALQGDHGHMVTTPLTTPDIFPTLLGLAGVKIPTTVEGEDLSPLLREGHEAEDRAALYMGVAPFVLRSFRNEYRAIRTSQYTYVCTLTGPWLLFDDQKDPYQMQNLVSDPQYRALQKTLDDQLHTQLKKVHDDFKPAHFYVKEWNLDLVPGGSVPYGDKAIVVQTPHR